MELKEGYKQTEAGIIPKDWNIVELNKLSEKIMVGIASSATHAYRESGVVMFRNQNIKPNMLDDSDILHIHPDYELLFKNKRLKEGDLLTARTGYPGTTCKVPKEYEGSQSFTTLITRIKPQSIDSDYLCKYLNSEKGKLFFEQNQIGGGQKNVNAGTLQFMPIPLPPTKAEQTAIATALSDMDNLITGLEKLIEKKKAIKQGAMQELLRPKEGWVVKRLGDFLDYEQPTEYLVTDTEYNDNNQTPVLTAGKTFILGYTNEEHGVFTNIPVIIFDDFTTAIKFVDFQFKAKSSAMKMLLPKSGVNLRLIYEIMLQIKFQVSDHKRHWIGTYKNLEITVPSTPVEQNEIATILSEMEGEILQLKIKLTKYQLLKQGMMQELLTGKTRLV